MKYLSGLLLLVTLNAYAEKADRTKPMAVEAEVANLSQGSDKTDIRTLEGNVEITQGTLHVVADRLVMKENKDGLRFMEAFGKPLSPVSLKQKREGLNDFVEAHAERLEFDERTDTIKLFTQAWAKSGSNELHGEYIIYNTATEAIEVKGSAPGTKAGEKPGRAKFVIYPKKADDASNKSAPDSSAKP